MTSKYLKRRTRSTAVGLPQIPSVSQMSPSQSPSQPLSQSLVVIPMVTAPFRSPRVRRNALTPFNNRKIDFMHLHFFYTHE